MLPDDERGQPSLADLHRFAVDDGTASVEAPASILPTLADLPATDPLVRAEGHRLVEAIEQVRRSAQLLALDPIEAYAPLALRFGAFMYHIEHDRQSWQRLADSPLFREGRS